AVSVVGEGPPFFGEVAAVRSPAGVWSATVGPLAPNWYGYQFKVDGLRIADPENRDIWVSKADVAPEGTSQQSLVFVPGPAADFMADKAVPHGAVTTERYFSAVTNTQRRLTVYTPPGYGRS